jgi:hypothetical protein
MYSFKKSRYYLPLNQNLLRDIELTDVQRYRCSTVNMVLLLIFFTLNEANHLWRCRTPVGPWLRRLLLYNNIAQYSPCSRYKISMSRTVSHPQ